MADNHESTMKWKLDIAQFKANIKDAKRNIQLANAEFKQSTAGAKSWGSSLTGLQAKIKQLGTVLKSQNTILNEMEKEYQTVSQEMGEASPQAQRLEVQIEQQKAAIASTERQLAEYNTSLEEMKAEQQAAESPVESLSRTISEQEKELEKLKQEYANKILGDSPEEAEQLANQIDELSSELNENKAKLNEATTAADQFDNTLKDAEGGADSLSSGFGAMEVAIGDLVSQGIQKAIDMLKEFAQFAAEAWQEFDEGADIAIRATGATGQSAKELTDNYANVARQIVASNEDIGSAVGEVSTRFGVSGQELERLSTQFLKFAQVNGVDVVNAVDSVQKSLNAYGLDLSNADGAMDTLTATAQRYGITVDTLTNGLVQNGAAFQEMGLSFEQSADFMGQMEISGANVDTVMQGLRKALKNATADGKDMNTALAELQDGIMNGANGMDGLTLAYDLFGKSGDQIYNAVKNGTLSFEDLANVATDTGGTLDNTFNETQDGPDKLALAFQKLKTDVGQVADNILSVLEPAMDWIADNFETLEPIIVAVGAALGVLAGALAIGALVTAVSTAFSVLGGVLAVAFSPVTLIIAGIAALVAGLVMLWQKNEGFRNFVTSAWEAIKTAVGTAIDGIVNFFTVTVPGAIDTMVNFFSNLPTNIQTFLTDTKNKVAQFVSNIVSKATEAGSKFLNNIINNVKNLPSKVWSFLQNAISRAQAFVGQFASKAMQAASQFVGNIVGGLASLPGQVVSVGMNVVRGIWNGISNGLGWIKGQIQGWVGNVKSFIKNLFGINSPSKWARDVIGQGIVEGIAVGFDKGLPGLEHDLKHSLNGMTMGLSSQISANTSGIVSNAFGTSDGNGINVTGANSGQTVVFNQTINSPKAVDRLTLYRETNSMLFSAKVGLNNV